MEELLTILGGGTTITGLLIWYIKHRMLQNEKKVGKALQLAREANEDNKIQQEQIKQLEAGQTEMKKDIREIRNQKS